jgi:hypothetical protein
VVLMCYFYLYECEIRKRLREPMIDTFCSVLSLFSLVWWGGSGWVVCVGGSLLDDELGERK